MKQKNRPFDETGDRTMFKVPENYFENFKVALDKRLDELENSNFQVKEAPLKQTESGKIFFTMERVKPFLYMAAMFVLLLFSISLVINLKTDKSSSLGLSADSNAKTTTTTIPTAEDYLINSVGTYGITEYYLDSDNLE